MNTVGEPDPRNALGREGERAAEVLLVDKGMRVLARGWRSRRGEIDLVMEDGEVLVFVEVKTRAGTGFGRPAEAVDGEKRKRMARAGCAFLTVNHAWERPCRFDVVEVDRSCTGDWRVSHIPDAFRLWRSG